MPINLAQKFTGKNNLDSHSPIDEGLKTSGWGKKEWLRLAVFLLVCGAVGYLTFSTFAASTVAHPDGSLIRFAGNPSVYMIQGGQKRGIMSENAFNSNHYNWGMVTAGNSADAALPNGPTIGIRAGTLVMTPGNPTVWIVVDGGNGNYSKWGIQTQAVFNGLGYSYNQVMTVPVSDLPPDSPNLITGANHAGGQFVVSGNGIVYMISNAGRVQVADQSVLATYNFPIYNAVPGDDALPIQGWLPYHEGSLMRGSTNTVYMIGCSNTGGVQGVCAMQKHGFADENTLYSLGYNFGLVVGGSDVDLSRVPTGAAVSLPPPCLPNNPLCNPPPLTPPPPPPPTCLPNNPLCTPPPLPSPPPPVTSPPPTPPPGVCLPNNPLCTPNQNYRSPNGNIDSPAAGAKVTGTVTISGWALDNTTKPETFISGISVTIEGHAAVGTLTRNINRSDVCSRYPGRAGCPNVGWEFRWNSQSVPNGTFEIEVKITDTDPGGYHTTTLTRNVTISNPIPPSGAIYSPASSSRVTGLITIRGWAMDNEYKAEHAITSVRISVNGSLVGNATYGQQNSTTDAVCNQYPGRPGCPRIGWSFALDTTQYQNGSTLNVKAAITDADTPPATTTVGTTYVVGSGQTQTCPAGQTGTPPNCKTPPPAGGSGATQTIQVVYAYPSDMSPRAVELNNIPVAISRMQTFLKNSTAGVLPSKPKGISLNLSSNIQRVALPRTTLQYEQAAGMNPNHTVYIGSELDNEVTKDLDARLSTANGKKYLVYIDGAFQDAGCGFGGGSWANWYINAIQWGDRTKNQPSLPCEDRGGNDYVGGPMPDSYFPNLGPLHELFHALGQVTRCAPNYDTNTANHAMLHATESQDLMHYVLNPPPVYVDVNHNDYYGPNLPANCLGLTAPGVGAYFNTL